MLGHVNLTSPGEADLTARSSRTRQTALVDAGESLFYAAQEDRALRRLGGRESHDSAYRPTGRPYQSAAVVFTCYKAAKERKAGVVDEEENRDSAGKTKQRRAG